MELEVINTGSELLLGNVVNTHLSFLGRALFPLGFRISRQIAVPDGEAIRGVLLEAFERSEIVLVTGGLGPTTDDVTREITADLLGMKLLFNAEVMTAIEARFARRGLVVSDRIQRQAMIPNGALILVNPNGTAPGLYFNLQNRESDSAIRHLFLLPGPPRELIPMFNEIVVPILKDILPQSEPAQCRIYRIVGLGESQVEALVGESLLAIKGLELGYCARPGEVELRIIGSASVLDQAEDFILSVLKSNIVSRDQNTLEQVVINQLVNQNKTIAVAESCTGGFLSNRFTNVPGASLVFLEGFVTYANESKIRELQVDVGMIERHGAVSAEVAVAMAEGALRVSGSDYALSTTGIAGPGGGSLEKPVGTVFIALALKQGEPVVERHLFPTDRENFKWLASQAALDLLRRTLSELK